MRSWATSSVSRMRRKPSKTATWILPSSISSRGPMKRFYCAIWRTRKTASRTSSCFSLQLGTHLPKSVVQLLLRPQYTLRLGNDVGTLFRRAGDHLLEVGQCGRIAEYAHISRNDLSQSRRCRRTQPQRDFEFALHGRSPIETFCSELCNCLLQH